MPKLSIEKAAVWGFLFGCLCMAVIIVYTGRARSVPVTGYIVDLLGGAVAGAGGFSLVSWIYNFVVRKQ